MNVSLKLRVDSDSTRVNISIDKSERVPVTVKYIRFHSSISSENIHSSEEFAMSGNPLVFKVLGWPFYLSSEISLQEI